MSTPSFGESQATSQTTATKSCSYTAHFENRERNCHLRTVTPNFRLKAAFCFLLVFWKIHTSPSTNITHLCGWLCHVVAKSPRKAWMSHTSGTFLHKIQANFYQECYQHATIPSYQETWLLEEWAATPQGRDAQSSVVMEGWALN